MQGAPKPPAAARRRPPSSILSRPPMHRISRRCLSQPLPPPPPNLHVHLRRTSGTGAGGVRAVAKVVVLACSVGGLMVSCVPPSLAKHAPDCSNVPAPTPLEPAGAFRSASLPPAPSLPLLPTNATRTGAPQQAHSTHHTRHATRATANAVTAPLPPQPATQLRPHGGGSVRHSVSAPLRRSPVAATTGPEFGNGAKPSSPTLASSARTRVVVASSGPLSGGKRGALPTAAPPPPPPPPSPPLPSHDDGDGSHHCYHYQH